MSKPADFASPQKYFEKCLHFLQRHSWIYEFSNTAFIREGVLKNFPVDWIEYFTVVNNEQLNQLPFRKITTGQPSLDVFLQELDSLIPNHVQLSIPTTNYKLKRMSLKKQHEICRLSALIQGVCGNEIDVLVDFGSGLGYLSELIYRSNVYKIIGIESDARRVQASNSRQTAVYPSSKKSVVFKEHFITNESSDFILANVKEITAEMENPRLAIIGLHSCADLTVNSMKLFLTMWHVQKLIIMPCCYHKLEMNLDSDKYGFKNFPLSKALKQAESENKSFKGFNRPFLRLACQQTSGRWKNLTEKEHHAHGCDMFLRASVEAILGDDEVVVKSRSKRIPLELNFKELSAIYELHSKVTKEPLLWTSEHQNRFSQLVAEYPLGHKLAEGLTCLQSTMQELCENIVLYDRVCYMEEQAAQRNLCISVKFEKIMDELLSPRCFALIAHKSPLQENILNQEQNFVA